MDKLLPCPFCGCYMNKRDELIEPITHHRDWCPLYDYETIDATIEAWNTRFNPPDDAGEIERNRVRDIVIDKMRRGICVEPYCGEPAQHYCTCHAGAWNKPDPSPDAEQVKDRVHRAFSAGPMDMFPSNPTSSHDAGEWREPGPWKCDKCGMFVGKTQDVAFLSNGNHHKSNTEMCYGTFHPFDRRAPWDGRERL